MKLHVVLAILMSLPMTAMAASRDGAVVRVGANRANQVGARMPSMVAGTTQMVVNTPTTVNPTLSTNPSGGGTSGGGSSAGGDSGGTATSESCRDAYRACMDEFCLLDDELFLGILLK